MNRSLARASTFIWIALLPSLAWAWGSDLALPPAAPVVDEFGLLQAGEVAQLENLVREIKQKSGVELTVFIPATLQGREIEDFSIAVAEKWQLGRKKEDKGLLLTIAPKERKMRFEVGYGLEGELTDLFTRRVLDDVMRPHFRVGQYYEGILGSLIAIQEKVPLGLEQSPAATFSKPPRRKKSMENIFFFVVVVLFVIFSILSRLLGFGRRRRGGFYGSLGGLGGLSGGGGWSSGGSSWGGGGGGFGGGGSSSSW